MQSTNRNDLTAKLLKKAVIAPPPNFFKESRGELTAPFKRSLKLNLP